MRWFHVEEFVIVADTGAGWKFVAVTRARFDAENPGILLGKAGRDALVKAVAVLQQNGATLLCGGRPSTGLAYRFANTLLQVAGETFLQHQ